MWKPEDFFPPLKSYADLAREALEMAEAAKPENRRAKALAMRQAMAAAFGITTNGEHETSGSAGQDQS